MTPTTAISLMLLAGLHTATVAAARTENMADLQQTTVVAALPTSLMLASAPEQTGAAAKPSDEPGAKSPLSVTTSGFGQLGARSDGKDGNGSLGVSRAGGVVGLAYRLDDTYTLTLNLRSTHYYFSFDNAATIAGKQKLFNDLNEYGIDPGVIVRFDDKWTGIFSGRLRWGGEPQNAFSDGFEGGGFAIASYRFSPELSLGFGLGVLSRIEDSARVVPLISVNWKVSPTVTVRSRRLGGEVAVELAKGLELIAGGEYEFAAFRLDESSQISNGVVRDRSASLDIALVYTIVPNVLASVSGGATVYRSIKVLNSSGQELDRYEADPAPYVGVKLEVKF